MEPSAPFMHDPPCSPRLWMWPWRGHDAPTAGSRPPAVPSMLFSSHSSDFLSLHSISAAPAVWRSLRCQDSLSSSLSSSGFNWKQLNPLFPHFSPILRSARVLSEPSIHFLDFDRGLLF